MRYSVNCLNCEILERELAQLREERDEARKRAREATNLMVKGEALRDRMKLDAILGGAYPSHR